MGREIRPREMACRFSSSGFLLKLNASIAIAFACLLLFCAGLTGTARAATTPQDPEKMLVEANEMVYNKDNDTVSAVGDVQIYYKGRVLQANRVTYNRKSKRVLAVGNAKITEADGSVTYGDKFDLTDNFKDGFIESLKVLGKDKTRLTSPHAERIDGNIIQLDKATYTACEPCKEHPERPPLWQVKATRVIHNKAEQTIYFENATLEVAGIPVFWLPFLTAPDSTVHRKTGFLGPKFINKSHLGFGVATPFFWNLAPNYDLTLTPTFLSRQGFLGEVEWRHRLEHGSYDVRVAGISPMNPQDFTAPPFGPGKKTFRGSFETTGKFLINPQWSFGWNIAVATDKYFYSDFKVPSETLTSNYFKELTSTLYLRGQSPRAFFDLRGYAFQGLSTTDYQKQLPIVAPVWDYHKTIDLPKERFGLLAGELGITFNLTSVSRETASFQSTVADPLNHGHLVDTLNKIYDVCNNTPVTPAGPNLYSPSNNCILRGTAGNYTRFSAEFDWRKQLIDPIGEVWTPFVYGRVDAAWLGLSKGGTYNDVLNSSNVALTNASQSNFFAKSESFVGRASPAIGLEYRYPFVAKTSWATHIFEPIAQIIARPSEQAIRSMPNEDAQSLVFDDTNLFQWNKFSGYDRTEGGVRLNAGVQYTMQFNRGGFANAMFGQSFQLAGKNSFSSSDVVNTGADSGLDSRRSDYVSRIAFSPSSQVSFIAKGRFDEKTFAVKRLDIISNFTLGGLTSSIAYGRYAPQPLIGFTNWREGLSVASKYNLTDRWWVSGSVVFDLARWKVVPNATRFSIAATGAGIGYSDECTTMSFNYTNVLDQTSSLAASRNVRNQTFMFQLNLRTLGDAGAKSNVGTPSQ